MAKKKIKNAGFVFYSSNNIASVIITRDDDSLKHYRSYGSNDGQWAKRHTPNGLRTFMRRAHFIQGQLVEQNVHNWRPANE